MKKFLAVLFVLCCATVASAAFDFGFFTIDVPGDWDVVEKADDKVTISAPDKSLAVCVMKVALDGAPLKDCAEAICKQYNGTDFRSANEGSFEFNATVNGVASYAQLWASDHDGFVMVVFMFGDHESEQAVNIFNSITEK